jgi:predicted site-specific integrase-resolvase
MLVRDDRKRYDVTARDAADQLGIHVETLKRWCRDGRVSARKNFVGAWMLSAEDIDGVFDSKAE